ncbi:MAG: 7-cyano-7-deazaguanine synthase [Actinobacteria bacterium]|nr:7-cyano-7-deazaguanine synthase [Actinomycetota bacterium]
MTSYTVVVNDCAAVPVVGGPISVRTRNTQHGDRNFLLNFDYATAGLPRQLTEREMDWLEVAGQIFAVDMACKRGDGDLSWARDITAHLPVRDPAYWQSQSPALQEIFGDFTSDRIHLHFESEPNPSPAPRQRSQPFPDHDCVALVSGGVDSFVGAVGLIADGRRTLAVSHTAAGATTRAQSRVEEVLVGMYSGFERVGLSAAKQGNSFPDPEKSQRSRSFLFLAVSALVASVGGTNEVFINENGPMAIHLPMTAARIGSLSTHTAAPAVLERVEALARMVLGSNITIRNTLLAMTKPEVVERGVQLGVGGPLAETVSCWSIGRTSRHCGVCAPCLIRRISFEWCGTSDCVYDRDTFGDPAVLDSESASDNLTHLIRLVEDLASKSDLDLQLDYPELLNGGRSLPLGQNIALHRRWADQALGVLSAYPNYQARR